MVDFNGGDRLLTELRQQNFERSGAVQAAREAAEGGGSELEEAPEVLESRRLAARTQEIGQIAEAALVQILAGDDVQAQDFQREQIAALREELAPIGSRIEERLLAEVIAKARFEFLMWSARSNQLLLPPAAGHPNGIDANSSVEPLDRHTEKAREAARSKAGRGARAVGGEAVSPRSARVGEPSPLGDARGSGQCRPGEPCSDYRQRRPAPTFGHGSLSTAQGAPANFVRLVVINASPREFFFLLFALL